ncbi:hypothetical protein Raf01_41670 [Rugosimonospora africana]|uniref:Uncharacterized protein n=1 Tax=Rugosimonospora africana TaxID=556532 RepID=A0A8J3QUF2_9ACTN|nr:hypothetical protein Raf01_41670 [Rugosimonospora africana]
MSGPRDRQSFDADPQLAALLTSLQLHGHQPGGTDSPGWSDPAWVHAVADPPRRPFYLVAGQDLSAEEWSALTAPDRDA